MLAQSLLLTLLAATAAVANPAPQDGDYIAKGFTPISRAWNGLEARQAGSCPAGYDECGMDGCVPLDGSKCCGSDGTFCRSGTTCETNGCCPVGKICTGKGGTRTLDFPASNTPGAPSASKTVATGSGSLSSSANLVGGAMALALAVLV